jgi:hypothetical protein
MRDIPVLEERSPRDGFKKSGMPPLLSPASFWRFLMVTVCSTRGDDDCPGQNGAATKRKGRWFQYTIGSLLLVMLLTVVVFAVFRPQGLAVFRPRVVVQVRATLLATRSLPDSETGRLGKWAVVRVENVGGDPVWVSGMGFVSFMRFHEIGTSAGTYSTDPLDMIRLDPGASDVLTIPLETTTTAKEICIAQKIAARRGAAPQIYWSGKLKADSIEPSATDMQPDTPPGVDVADFWNRLGQGQ